MSGAQGSLVYLGLSGWSLLIMTNELLIYRVSWSLASSSVVELSLGILYSVASLYTGPR